MMMAWIYSMPRLVDLSRLNLSHEYPLKTMMIWIYSMPCLVDLCILAILIHEYPLNWKIIFLVIEYLISWVLSVGADQNVQRDLIHLHH